MVEVGIESITKYKELFSGKRVGLVTSLTGMDRTGKSSVDILREICDLTVIFSPEHGLYGAAQAGDHVDSCTDSRTGIKVVSLYGRHRHLHDSTDLFDVLVYDIQDVGARFYTYVSTLAIVMEDCMNAGKKIIVADRPNPASASITEGLVMPEKYQSFVGVKGIPTRYGLTIGELALYFKDNYFEDCNLKVIPCKNYSRKQFFTDTGRNWILPSPNIPDPETSLIYLSTCFFEGTNISEGRGTTRPFTYIGAPFFDEIKVADEVNSWNQKGIFVTPVCFTPIASKLQNETCHGIHIHLTDASEFRAVSFGTRLLDYLLTEYADDMRILEPVEGREYSMLTMLFGDEFFGDKKRNIDEMIKRMEKESRIFSQITRKYHLYGG